MYHTINELSEEYVNNFTKQYMLNVLYPNSKAVTKDADISKVRLIMLDFDPKRPADTSSTDEEKAKAYECMSAVLEGLKASGIDSTSYTTDSGNGYNAYISVDFPNDVEHNKLIGDFIGVLHDKFSDEAVDVDRSTKNPARIAKVPSSWSCKGDNTPERPHRMCQLLEANEDVKPVSAEQLKIFINSNKPQKQRAERKSVPKLIKVVDVAGWLDHHKLEYKVKEGDSTLYILKTCPFAEHDNDYCCFLAQGADMSVSFKCHHDHCTQTIHDFVAKYPVPKQIPLFDGDDKKDILYNKIVSVAKLMKSHEGKEHIYLNSKMVAFNSEECYKEFYKLGAEAKVLLSETSIRSVHSLINAYFDDYSETVSIGTRIVHDNSGYYYALSPEKFVHISNGTVQITDNVPVYFTYNPKFVSQPDVDLTSPASALPDLVDEVFNISPQNKLKFLAQLCSFFMPNLPTPILVLSGGHGTSKTTTARKIVKLVAPKLVDVMSLPDKEDGLTTALSNNYLTVIDNIDSISSKFSDILCMACTGGHIVKRQLYTDNTVMSAPIKTHVILNGIGDFVNRPDLAERSNIIYLDPITKRLTEKQVWSKFNSLKPQILGSIFNTIAKGLTLVDSCEAVADLPRMADFAEYGVAFITAMGLDADAFIKEYCDSNTQLLADCSSNDPFIKRVKGFVESKNGSWNGTASQLIKELDLFAANDRSNTEKFTPSTLSRKLNQYTTDFKATGITVEIKGTTPKSITLTSDSVDNNVITF